MLGVRFPDALQECHFHRKQFENERLRLNRSRVDRWMSGRDWRASYHRKWEILCRYCEHFWKRSDKKWGKTNIEKNTELPDARFIRSIFKIREFGFFLVVFRSSILRQRGAYMHARLEIFSVGIKLITFMSLLLLWPTGCYFDKNYLISISFFIYRFGKKKYIL